MAIRALTSSSDHREPRVLVEVDAVVALITVTLSPQPVRYHPNPLTIRVSCLHAYARALLDSIRVNRFNPHPEVGYVIRIPI